MRGGVALACWVRASRRGVSTGTAAKRLVTDLPFQRRPAAPHLAARRPPRARTPTPGSTGSPTRARRGGRCCRSGRPTATARPTRRRRRSRPGRGCWPSRARRCRRPRSSTSASATRTGSRTGRAFGRRGAVADQVRFDREWAALRALRRRARRAADRRRPDLRRARLAPTTARTRSCSRPARVAGTPPDAFTDKGQLWGNPLYDWPALQRARLPLVDRRGLRRTFELFDLARIDHFRGFVAYWAVPRGARARARAARWRRGPGRARVRRRARGARASCR